jgi:ABC-type transport system involved in multi-copper enzyme maturation permease subunit
MNNKKMKNKQEISKSLNTALIITFATIKQLLLSKKVIGIIILCLIPIIVFSLWSADAFPQEKETLYEHEYADFSLIPEEVMNEDLDVTIYSSLNIVEQVELNNTNTKALRLRIQGVSGETDNHSVEHMAFGIFLFVTEFYSIDLGRFMNASEDNFVHGPVETDEIVFRGNHGNGTDWGSWEFNWTSEILLNPFKFIETHLRDNPGSIEGISLDDIPLDGLDGIERLSEYFDIDIRESIRLGFFVIGFQNSTNLIYNFDFDYVELYPIFEGDTIVDFGRVGIDTQEKIIEEDGYEIFMNVATVLFFLFIIPLISILYAISAMREDIENHTIVYLITRPISKFELLLFKFKGFFISAWIPIAISMIICFFIVSFTEGTPFLHLNYIGILLMLMTLAILAYGAIFCIFAVTTSYPIVISLLYVFLWETTISNQQNVISRYSILFHIQSMAKGWLGDIFNTEIYQPMDPTTSFITLCGAIICIIGLAMFVFNYRDFT